MPRFVAASNRIYRVANLTPSGSTFTPNFYNSDVCDIALSGGNYFIDEPSGNGDPFDGQRLTLRIKQDSTGGRTLTWDSVFEFPQAASLYLNPTANSVSIFEFQYRESDDTWVHLPHAAWGVARGIVGRRTRNTQKTGITSNTPVLSVRAPIEAGRTYKVVLQCEVFTVGGGANVTSQTELRYTTDDTEPDTTDTQLTRTLIVHPEPGIPTALTATGYYQATADGYLRVVACTQRALGSGSVAWEAGTGYEGQLTIEDVGPSIPQDPLGQIY